MSDLPPGGYKLYFDACDGQLLYFPEWYDNQEDFESADVVAVVSGETTTGIDVALSQPGEAEEVGDANCDGEVTSVDASLVLQFSAGLLTSLPCQDGADANRDGEITSIDATLILQFTAGLLGSLPLESVVLPDDNWTRFARLASYGPTALRPR